MRMSTVLVNGIQAENGIQNLTNNIPGSHFENSKMKNISNSGGDLNRLLCPKVESNNSLTEEMSSLKELLVIHLDYIQQLSEQLSKKNKHNADLKNENEMLKQRLARMERRVSLQKPRGDRKQYTGDGSGEIIGRKRRLTTDLPPQAPASSSQGKKSFGYHLPDGPLPAKRIKQGVATCRIKQEPEENESVINLDDILTTRTAYHTLVGERPNCLLKYVKKSKKQKAPHLQLEVPRWRIKPLTSTYSMEGTEDLSDDAFNRRHYKLMGDEKKRKRWDVQRIRDQRTRDLLKLREKGDKRVERQQSSLWPQYTDGLCLSVTPLVPVSAFGINLPASNIQDFSLPWKEGTTRHSNCRRRTKR